MGVLKNFDIVILTETWARERSEEMLKDVMPDTYDWLFLEAKKAKEGKKGRPSGGLVIGSKKALKGKLEVNEYENGLIGKVKFHIGMEEWVWAGVYVRSNTKTIWEKIEGTIGKKERIVIAGDFNARIEEKSGAVGQEERNSKDKVMNNEGKKLIGKIIENDLWILNGGNEGDENGEYTQLGKGSTVIDYALTKEEIKGRIRMKVANTIESDHEPIEVEIKGRWEEEETEQGIENIAIWDEEGTKRYKEEIKKKLQGVNIKDLCDLKSKMIEAMYYRKKRRGIQEYREKWWDEECNKKKSEYQKMKRRFRAGKIQREKLVEKKGEYTRCIQVKKEEYAKDLVKKIEECKNEKELWKVTRKRREGVSNKIRKEEWYEYFRKSYKGLDEENINRVTGRTGIEISEEEVDRAIKN